MWRIVTVIKSLVLLCLCALALHAETLTARVVAIADGDTITVLDNSNTQHKVRFNGIDAPESSQAFGQASKRNLSTLIGGKTVTVEWTKIDRYGRLIGTVTLDGRDVSLEQLKAGLAWYYRAYERDVPPDKRQSYTSAEAEARVARRGLWADANPHPPWEFRHPDATAETKGTTGGKIIGNKNSGIYHAPNCPDYNRVSERNRVPFDSESEAVKAGYRKARNCP